MEIYKIRVTVKRVDTSSFIISGVSSPIVI